MRRLFLIAILSAGVISGASAQVDTLWTQTYGGAGQDGARAMVVLDDGGTLMAGYTYSSGAGDVDAFLVRTGPDGSVLWSRPYGGPGRDFAIDVCATSDGGFVFTGFTTSAGQGKQDLYLVKVDSGGDEVWSRTYGGAEMECGSAVLETADGHLLVSGWTASRGAGGADLYLIKAAAGGDTVWTRTFGGAEWDRAEALCETDDGCYGICGTTGSMSENRDIYLLKVAADGALLWENAYGSLTRPNADFGADVLAAPGGGLVALGYGNDHTVNDAEGLWLFQVDGAGSVEWQQYITEGQYYEYGLSFCRPVEGTGYLLCGAIKDPDTQTNDIYLVRTDDLGSKLWSGSFGFERMEWGTAVGAGPNGGFMVAGHTTSHGAGSYDLFLASLSDPAVEVEPGDGPTGDLIRLRAPNPFRPGQEIRFDLPEAGMVGLDILDVAGRRVDSLLSEHLGAGTHSLTWNPWNVPAGVFCCVLRTEKGMTTRKMILLP